MNFAYFSRLPPEIRRAIWQASIVPRIIVATREVANSCIRTALRSQKRAPAIAHACFESRRVFLENYEHCWHFGFWEEMTEYAENSQEAREDPDGYFEEVVELDSWLWFNPRVDTVLVKDDSAFFRGLALDQRPPSPHLVLRDADRCIRESGRLAYDSTSCLPSVKHFDDDDSVFDLLPEDTGTFFYVAGAWVMHLDPLLGYNDSAGGEIKMLFEGDQKVVMVDIADTNRLRRFLKVYREYYSWKLPKVRCPAYRCEYDEIVPVLDEKALEQLVESAGHNRWVRESFYDSFREDWVKYQTYKDSPQWSIANPGPGLFEGEEKSEAWVKEMLARTPKVEVVLVFYLCENDEHPCPA